MHEILLRSFMFLFNMSHCWYLSLVLDFGGINSEYLVVILEIGTDGCVVVQRVFRVGLVHMLVLTW